MSKMLKGATFATTYALSSTGGNATCNKGGNATCTMCVYMCVWQKKSGKTVDRAVPGQSGKVSNTITPQPQPILTLRGHVYEKVAINAGFTIHHLQEVQGL